MPHSLRHILARPTLLLLAIMIFVQGSAYGATLPYLSVVAIRELGMSNQAYSALVFTMALSAVTISVSLGILSDMMRDRRIVMMGLALVGVLGYGAIFTFPSIPVFVVATAAVIPFYQSLNAMIFATVRTQTLDEPPRDAAAINATVRAFMSASWVVMPMVVGLAFANSGSLLNAWGAASLCALTVLVCTIFLPGKADEAAANTTKGSAFLTALKDIARPNILARTLSMASLTGTVRLSSMLFPLILTTELGGSTANVGFIAGLTALLEIPFMLAWAAMLRWFSIITVLTAAACIYATYLTLLSLATAPWHIYVLTLPGAAGAAALLAMPLTYFQELFPDRPGLGTSFNPIIAFLGNGLTAIAFALGTLFFGYSGVAWLGVAMVLSGISGLIVMERRQAAQA